MLGVCSVLVSELFAHVPHSRPFLFCFSFHLVKPILCLLSCLHVLVYMHYLLGFVCLVLRVFCIERKHKLIAFGRNEQIFSLFLTRNLSPLFLCSYNHVGPHRKMDQINSLVVCLFALYVETLRQI